MNFPIKFILFFIGFFAYNQATVAQNSTSQDRHDFLVSQRGVGGVAAAGNVGYYNMSFGQGDMFTEENPIIKADQSPVQIFELSEEELSNIDVLFVTNPDNGLYGAEYLAQLAVIQNAVNNGLILIIHDRYVDDAAMILPGGAGILAFRDFSDDANVDIVDNTTALTAGLDDTSLDNGLSSTHGFVDGSSLPAGGSVILSRTIPNEGVTVTYPFGAGFVIYSTIPLDFYLDEAINNPNDLAINMCTYASNSISFALDLRADAVTIIPTMGEWGLISLAILLIIFGITGIRQRSIEVVGIVKK